MSTVGRKPRKRAKKAGLAVHVRPHKRTPRGLNKGKGVVHVNGYRRGKPGK